MRCIPWVKTQEATAHVNTREARSNTWALHHGEFLRTRTDPRLGPVLYSQNTGQVGGLRQAPKFMVVLLSLVCIFYITLAGLFAIL